MARSEWNIIVSGTNVNSLVLNANFSVGRQSFLDDYATNYATITARNNLGQFNSMTPGELLRIVNVGASKTYPFWLESITYNDGIDADASTVTLTYSDVMGKLAKALSVAGSGDWGNYQGMAFLQQAFDTAVADGSLVAPPTYVAPTGNLTNHQQIDMQNSESLAQIVNVVLSNEGGGFYTTYVNPALTQFRCVTQDMIYRSVTSFTFGEAATTTKLVWDQMSRSNFGDLFANAVTLEYWRTDIGSAGTYKNSTSIASYGVYQNTFDNFNNTYSTGAVLNVPPSPVPSPALALGTWYSTVLANTNLQTYQIRISDFAQNATAMTAFENAIETLAVSLTSLTYNKPNVGLTTERVKVEGYTVTIEPDATYYDLYFSPISIYSQLTLNQTEQGKLDTYRLGY